MSELIQTGRRGGRAGAFMTGSSMGRWVTLPVANSFAQLQFTSKSPQINP
jgi:hypothetical protein